VNNPYPKVLFVTPCAFNRETGGGITFSNLFKGWPADRLATIHRDFIPTSNDICRNFYRLSRWELTPSVPLTSGILNAGQLSGGLEKWIRAFSPEVLYTILGTVGYVQLVHAIHNRFKIPIVLHLMDEGATDPELSGLLGRWVRGLYGNQLRTIAKMAASAIGICPLMSDAYSQRFERPFETFMNSVDLQRHPARKDVRPGTPLRLVYTGAILPYAQEQSLRDITRVVAAMHRSGMPIQFDIYASQRAFGPSLQSLAIPGVVFVHDAIRDDEIYFNTLKQADILVLPANFDSRSRHFIRYSMPTKIPSYLSSGTPILLFGPSDIAQVQYAQQDKWGLVVNVPDMNVLESALRRLSTDTGLRQSLSQAAIETARNNHNSSVVRQRFRTLLSNAAA